jgi:hypothetical protein
MSSSVVALIVFVCVFGSGMLGLALRTFLPDHHLSEDSTAIVKLGAGLMATLAALVLGLRSPRQRFLSTGSTTSSRRRRLRSS